MKYKYLYPQPVNKNLFKKDDIPQETLYGLPVKVLFCQRCVINNQRPSSTVEFKNNIKKNKEVIEFDANSICDACKVKDKKEVINWDERERELKELCNKYRKNDGSYDCLIPGSGGKDSFYQAHLLKYKYGMNPLTCTWAPNIYTDWGWKNHQAWIHAGFSNSLFTPNGKVHRLLTRLAMENLFHPFQPFILGQKNHPIKVAHLHNIELIFYGENEAEYGNKKSDYDISERSNEFFTLEENDDFYLGGASLEELKEFSLTKNDLEPYLPLEPQEIYDSKIRVHYLGYYHKWHPQSAYYYAVNHGGFMSAPERTLGTYQAYASIDDKIDDFHYHTTYIKFGIGRATYDASQEVRSGDLTREEGIALVNKYDGEYPLRWSNEVFKYLSLPKEQFPQAEKLFEKELFDKRYYDLLCDNFRSPHLWYWDDDFGWELRNKITSDNVNLNIKYEWQGNKNQEN